MPPPTNMADAKKKSKDKPKEKKSTKEKNKKKSDSNDTKPKRKSDNSEASSPVVPIDPDAVQLFRRYDRVRTGTILRCDFLQLLRDYAQLPRASYGGTMAPTRRLPLSLTDSRGIPLGYERSATNSEFEAGQLFERYDKDHTGALTLDKFADFFNDFHAQLRGFVDDLSYMQLVEERQLQPNPREQNDSNANDSARQGERSQPPNPMPTTSVRAEYQATLWELRKLCKDELAHQRERIRTEMINLRQASTSTTKRKELRDDWSSAGDPYAFPNDRNPPKWSSWRDNQLLDRYDSIESDLERLDEVMRVTRRQLRKGMDVTMEDMHAFLLVAPLLLADARELAMKVYRVPDVSRVPREEPRDELSPPSGESKQVEITSPQESLGSAPTTSKATTTAPLHPNSDHATVEQLHTTLRIKDQLIYQLLQERTALRRQKAAIESDLHELTEVSTHEMRKWAQLTDEMQEEIALLRDQLSRVNRHHGGDSVFSYTNTNA